MLRGAQLAAQQINDAGGILGADGRTYSITVVDSSPQSMDIAIANMRQARVIAVLGPESDGLVEDYLSSLQALGVPIFTPATGDTILLPDISARIFRSRAAASLQFNALADYLVNALDIRTIRTIQLDRASLVSLITLANALSGHGIRPSNMPYDVSQNDLEDIAQSVMNSQPDAVAIYGPPRLAALAFNQLRGAGYQSTVVYNDAAHQEFVEIVPTDDLSGIIGTTTWSPSQLDSASGDFALFYLRAFGRAPDAIAASSYDALRLIASVAGGSSPIAESLAAIQSFDGVQGELSPAELSLGEISSNVVVTRLNAYGAPIAVAHYHAGQRLSNREIQRTPDPPTPVPSATPAPTATPSGFSLKIKSAVQNVRSGPGLQYAVIGQLPLGTQERVLGATVDFSWLVIDFRGQWGWLAAYLVDTFGNRNLLPIIQPPATPTPVATATTAPPRDADLVVLHAQPPRIIMGQPATVTVTVLNQGLAPTGSFAIATTFNPGGNYGGVNTPGLGPGQQTTVNLPATLAGPTGRQSVIIVVDLNEQVPEGAAGEANNRVYSYNYIADRPILSSGNWTIAPGSYDVDGLGTPDFHWTGSDLITLGSAGMYLLGGFSSIEDTHFDAINPSLSTITALNANALSNAMLAFVTAEGNRGVMVLSNVTFNGPITMEYRVYQ